MESPVPAGVVLAPRPLFASMLLDLWELGASLPPPRRALAILATACPGAAADTLGRLSIGRRDEVLLDARERTFGRRMSGLVSCPECGIELELTIDADDIRTIRDLAAEPAEPLTVAADGYLVTFRLPTSEDLLVLDDRLDIDAARTALFTRCVIGAERDQVAVMAGQLPSSVISTVVEKMSAVDPLADLHVPIRCAECGHDWQAGFDVLLFFWAEIEAAAARLRREVHVLASAYGWTESAILALGPVRRRAYLELIDP